jgi:SH3 domain protein
MRASPLTSTVIIAGAALALQLAAQDLRAETGFIIDKVEVGLHQNKSADSPILKLLPTGTRLEILARDGKQAQVRDPEGVVGWIDARYLTGDKSTRQLLTEAETEIARLKSELQAAQSTATAQNPAQFEAMRQENEKLKQQLMSERLKAGELQAELTELRKQAVPGDIAALKDQITALKSENRRLSAAGNPAAATQTAPKTLRGRLLGYFADEEHGLRRWFITLLIMLAVGVGAGAYLIDYLNRRRHGGFRI